jgi:hypothetical protein
MKTSIPKCGEYLGSGVYKSCFALRGNRVALIWDPEEDADFDVAERTFKPELRRYKELAELGFRVPKVKLGRVLLRGKIRKALIMRRFKACDRDAGFEWREQPYRKKLIANLKKIHAKIVDLDVDITDIQFGLDGKGGVWIIDPLEVDSGWHYATDDINKILAKLIP